MAPEIFLNKGYEGFGVDIWSAGVILYSMLGEKAPFNADKITELKDLIIKGEYKPLDNISPEARDLIKNMLEINPKKKNMH